MTGPTWWEIEDKLVSKVICDSRRILYVPSFKSLGHGNLGKLTENILRHDRGHYMTSTQNNALL